MPLFGSSPSTTASAADATEALLNASRSRLQDILYPDLPWPLSIVPPVCRTLATAVMAPVILLTVLDVGGYLLFKIFYKPFGTYPRYSYFKQSTADPIPGGTSPGVSPGVSPASKTIPLVSTPPTSSSSSTEPPSSASPSLRLRKNASQAASTDSSSATSPGQKFLSVKNGGGSGDEEDEKRQRIQRAQSIGFEGPMLESDDLRSPSGSEYGDDSEPDSPRTGLTNPSGAPSSSGPTTPAGSFSGRKGFGMTPVSR